MKHSIRSFLIALAAVVLGQTLALASIVYGRVSLLKTGREVTLPVVPLDPRDIFRGDYVMLGYGLSPIQHLLAKDGPLPSGLYRGGPIYVTIAPPAEGGGTWKVVRYGESRPVNAQSDQVILKGRIAWLYGGENSGDTTIGVHYGIENYFVPEGTGQALEQAVKDHKVEAVIAVGGDGTAAIKSVVLDGKREDPPPLF